MIHAIVIGDFHWDALDAIKQSIESEWILTFIKHALELDLVVIAGDYFDTRIMLNSKSSLYAIRWMSSLVEICRERKVKIRIIRGTISHDHNQLDAFAHYEKEDPDQFKIFRECTFEETLPGYRCLYCPDETIPNKEYYEKYHHLIYENGIYDAMYFHGSFDVVVPNIVVQESEASVLNNVIFEYNLFESIARVMIGGHWHDGDHHGHMYYTRSVNRWAFGEEKPKGFIYLAYDQEDHSYLVQRIENIFTDHYVTFSINTTVYRSIDDYRALIEDIDELLSKDEEHILKVRIKIFVEDELIETDNGIMAVKQHYMNEKRVKIVQKNSMKDKKKKEIKKRNEIIRSEFNFINEAKSPAEKIQQFIFHQKGRSIPLDVIESFIQKYLK